MKIHTAATPLLGITRASVAPSAQATPATASAPSVLPDQVSLGTIGAFVAPAPPQPPPEPTPRGTVYRPAEDGRYVRTRKHHLNDFARPIPLGAGAVFVARGPFLTRTDAQGAALYEIPLDPTCRFYSVEPAHDGARLYVLTSKGLTVLDAGTGAETSRVDLPPGSWMPRVTPLEDGRVLLTGGKKMLTLGPDLQPVATRDLNFEPTHVAALVDGTIVLHESMRGRHLQVIAPNGETILEKSSEQASIRPTVTPEGKIWWLEHLDSPPNASAARQNTITCFDPATRTSRTFDTANRARSIYPRTDGSCLVHDEPVLVTPRFVLHDRDGRVVRTFTATEEGAVEQLILSADEHAAWFVYDCYRGLDSKDRTSAIERFDLDARGGALSEGLGFIAQQVGISRTGVRIYEGERDPKRFFPTVLGDGSLLIFHEKSVDRIDSDGKIMQRSPDASSVTALRPRANRDLMRDKAATTVDEHLANFQHDYQYVDLNKHRPPGSALPTSDGCVSVEQGISREDAAREMALEDAEIDDAVKSGLIERIFAPQTLQTEGTIIPFPGSGGARVVLGRETLDIETPHPGGGKDEYDRVSYGFDGERTFTGALPVRSGGRHFVVAATADGRVYWLDGRSRSLDSGCPRYDLGSRVNRLITANGRIYGFGEDGSVLVIDPPRGVTLDSAPSSALGTSCEKTARVIVSEREVKIGGIAIPRRSVQ